MNEKEDEFDIKNTNLSICCKRRYVKMQGYKRGFKFFVCDKCKSNNVTTDYLEWRQI